MSTQSLTVLFLGLVPSRREQRDADFNRSFAPAAVKRG
jgi:hypothetical protein